MADEATTTDPTAIDNAQAVKFCNEKVRVLADALASAYWTAKAVEREYYANPELGTAFTDGIALAVADGADVDGRPRITGNDALGMITRASALVADLEADGYAKLNVILGVAVNGQGRV